MERTSQQNLRRTYYDYDSDNEESRIRYENAQEQYKQASRMSAQVDVIKAKTSFEKNIKDGEKLGYAKYKYQSDMEEREKKQEYRMNNYNNYKRNEK